MQQATTDKAGPLRGAIDSLRKAASGAPGGASSPRVKIPSWAPRVAELAAVIVIGVALAKAVGAWLYPLPVSSAPTPAVSAPPEAPITMANPFIKALASAASGGTADEAAVEAVDTSLNLTLYGTWAESENASATIGQDGGTQKVYRIGDEICCGARLERVFTTHVLINRGGALEALRLPNKLDQAGGPDPIALANAAQGGTDFSSLVALQPTLSPSGKLEFSVAPAGDPELFAQIGLQENDVIVSVNGQAAPASADKVGAFIESLRGAAAYKVVVRRSGSTVTVDIEPPLAARGQEG